MSKHILIIEDSQVMAQVMQEALSQEGHQVNCADSGEHGLEYITANNPDIVVLDTLLPGMDGFETCEKIKAAAGKDGAPKVIIVTGSVDAVDAKKAREAGADGYCVKTSELEHLLSEVKKFA